MEKWKLCVEELSSVITQITQDPRISIISTLLMPVNTYPTATNTAAGSAQPKAASTAALQRS